MTYEPTTWPGARLPHVWLADGMALHDRIGDGYTLLRLAGAQADSGPLARAFAALAAPLTVLDVGEARPRDVYGYDLLLLRPDLHVVWRGNRLPDDPARLRWPRAIGPRVMLAVPDDRTKLQAKNPSRETRCRRKPNLTLACGDYEIVRPLLTGQSAGRWRRSHDPHRHGFRHTALAFSQQRRI